MYATLVKQEENVNNLLTDKKLISSFVLPAFFIYAGMVLLPIAISFFFSLNKWDGIGEMTFNGTKNYAALFSDSVFWKSVWHTFILAFLTILIQIPAALVIALVLSAGVKGEFLFRTVYFIPVILPSTVIGLLWKRIYDPSYGLLAAFLKAVGLSHLVIPWLGNLSYALICVSAPIIWQWIGYHMLLLYAAAKNVDKSVREAASIDGASFWQTARHIVIPQMLPMIKVCITLAVVGSLKHFDIVYVMTKGGPANATEMPATLLVRTLFNRYQYGYGSAMAVFIVVECLLLTILLQRLFKSER